MAESFDSLVRRVDFDRYLASLFAPQALRSRLLALYAFNHEVAKVAETVSQPIAGQIRLQWWRDRIADLYHSDSVEHPIVEALGEVIAAHGLPAELFDALIDARERDLEQAPFADLASLEAYADATSGHVMRLAARILGAGNSLDEAARSFGIAYALAGLCRALPFHASRARLMLPGDRVAALGISVEDFFSGKSDHRLSALIAELGERAKSHLHAGRKRIARALMPALLPAALVPLYFRVLTRRGFEPFRDPADIAVHRRQLAMLGAMLKGRI